RAVGCDEDRRQRVHYAVGAASRVVRGPDGGDRPVRLVAGHAVLERGQPAPAHCAGRATDRVRDARRAGLRLHPAPHDAGTIRPAGHRAAGGRRGAGRARETRAAAGDRGGWRPHGRLKAVSRHGRRAKPPGGLTADYQSASSVDCLSPSTPSVRTCSCLPSGVNAETCSVPPLSPPLAITTGTAWASSSMNIVLPLPSTIRPTRSRAVPFGVLGASRPITTRPLSMVAMPPRSRPVAS